jgi:hypothetical protein
MAYERHTCDRCDFEAGGFDKKELEKDGWVWHKAASRAGTPTVWFVMCDSCEMEIAEKRAKAAA